jgi:transposase
MNLGRGIVPKHVGQTDIASWLTRIDKSKSPIRDFFVRRRVPFSVTQYYRYKKRIAAKGVESLRDKREQGNHRLMTVEAEGYLKGYLAAQPEASLLDAREVVKKRFGIEITTAGMSRCLKRLGVERKARVRETKVQRFYVGNGGLELIIALACQAGWSQMVSDVIQKRIRQIKKSELWQAGSAEDKGLGRNEQGQFTARYNRNQEVRERRFASIESKMAEKNYRTMNLSSVGPLAIERKVLAMLTLPPITNNGMIRSVNMPMGNALSHLCGFNYKHATLTKFMAELKYLGVAEYLLRRQVGFWQEFWKRQSVDEMELPILCYYVDGNTKALWSKTHVKKNKVTMLGRVMGCVEMLFVHDSFGRPIYFETYAGHAPMGEYILSLFDKIENSLEGSGRALPVNRAIVMDAASNGVRTLRAFADQHKYHYITALDDNQWNERKTCRQGKPQRYRYGNATLTDGEIELEDSQEKGYLISSRAIRIDWDYGKQTMIVTSLEPDVVGPSEVVKAYFDRWPYQELGFREMKKVACLNRIAGYGRQQQEDRNVVKKQGELRKQISSLRAALAEPQEAITKEEAGIAELVKKECKLREASRIEGGKRILSQEKQEQLKEVRREIKRGQRQITIIMQPERDRFRKLSALEREWLRLQGKEKVYSIDVQLDEIMTFFRVSLANIYSRLAQLLFGKKGISMNRLVMSILQLPALIEETAGGKTVTLKYNKKDATTMSHLNRALGEINGMGLKTLAGKAVEFRIAELDNHLMSIN